MTNIPRLFIIGAVTIAAVYIFRYQSRLAENVVGRVKTKEPDQIVIAAAMVVGLGLVGVVAASAFRKV